MESKEQLKKKNDIKNRAWYYFDNIITDWNINFGTWKSEYQS